MRRSRKTRAMSHKPLWPQLRMTKLLRVLSQILNLLHQQLLVPNPCSKPTWLRWMKRKDSFTYPMQIWVAWRISNPSQIFGQSFLGRGIGFLFHHHQVVQLHDGLSPPWSPFLHGPATRHWSFWSPCRRTMKNKARTFYSGHFFRVPNNPNRNDDADRVLSGLMVLRGIINYVDSLATIRQSQADCSCM